MTANDLIREICKRAKEHGRCLAVDFEPTPDGFALTFRRRS